MERLFVSRFVHFFRTKDGTPLAYCSKTNSFIELFEQIYSLLQRCQSEKMPLNESSVKQDVLQTLVNEGFVGKWTDDEDYILSSQFLTQTVQHDKSKLNLVLAPTLDCNFDCSYCFEGNKHGGVMSNSTIDKLLDFIEGNEGKDNTSLTWYGGEPLLAINAIEKILHGIDNMGIKLQSHSIVTNGYYFEGKAIDVFRKYTLNNIQITLDGRKERHDKLRKQKGSKSPSYDRIIENIAHVSKEFPGARVSVRVNVDKGNVDDYYALFKEMKEKERLDNVVVYPGIIRLDNAEKTNIVEPALGCYESSYLFYDIYSKGMLGKEVYPCMSHARICCASSANSFIIGPLGEIYKCWNDVSDKTRIVGCIDGNDIVNKQLYYRYHVGCVWYNDAECRSCFYLPICNGKCAWYNERNLYHGGEYNLCQCMQKAPGLLDKCLEDYYKLCNK